jgi:hypothetical protein
MLDIHASKVPGPTAGSPVVYTGYASAHDLGIRTNEEGEKTLSPS